VVFIGQIVGDYFD